jgi:hypothetical protein
MSIVLSPDTGIATPSPVVLEGSSSGTVTLAAPAAAGSTTITFPATTGTVALLSTVVGPTFSAYRNAARNITGGGTWTAVIPDTEEFDTASCYNTTTGRFTPNVAGYYQINGSMYSSGTNGELITAIYKNGAAYKYGARVGTGSQGANVSSIVYFNGTTDYVELYVYYDGPATIALAVGSTIYCYMNGAFIRGA